MDSRRISLMQVLEMNSWNRREHYPL